MPPMKITRPAVHEVVPKGVGFLDKTRNLVRNVPPLILEGGNILALDETLAQRLDLCEHACPGRFWNPAGNAGLGECRHPDCGCTKFKLRFAKAECPLKVWLKETR